MVHAPYHDTMVYMSKKTINDHGTFSKTHGSTLERVPKLGKSMTYIQNNMVVPLYMSKIWVILYYTSKKTWYIFKNP